MYGGVESEFGGFGDFEHLIYGSYMHLGVYSR